MLCILTNRFFVHFEKIMHGVHNINNLAWCRFPGASELKVKLVFADRSGIVLGDQVSGGPSAGELINMIALAIQKKVVVRELDMLQIATHLLLTSAPTLHPVINAVHQALAKLRAVDREFPSTKKAV